MELKDVTLNAAILNTANDQMEEVWSYVFDRKRRGMVGPLDSSPDEESEDDD